MATTPQDSMSPPADSIQAQILAKMLAAFQETGPINDTTAFVSRLSGFMAAVDRMTTDFALLEIKYETLQGRYASLRAVHSQVLQDQGRQTLEDKLRRIPISLETAAREFKARDLGSFEAWWQAVRWAEAQHGITQDLTPGEGNT